MTYPSPSRSPRTCHGVALALLLCARSVAAGSPVDLSFDPGSGADGTVSSVLLQPDGRILVTGTFSMVKGLLRTNLARLTADGSGDPSFMPVTPFPVRPWAVLARQPDGKILLTVDDAEICDEWGCYRPLAIQRLNPDGTLDPDFTPAIIEAGACRALVVQPDGKLLVGGEFKVINGTNRPGIARLNADGTLDATFNPQPGLEASISRISLEADGSAIIAGGLGGGLTLGTTNFRGFGRIHPSGRLDEGFNPASALVDQSDRISSVAIQPDGRILAGGYFTLGERRNLVRFNPDGSVDPGFDAGAGPDGEVSMLVLQPDGKVLLAGYDLTSINGIARKAIARLHPDGSPDLTFDAGTRITWPSALTLQPDGRILVGRFGGSDSGSTLVRLKADGTLDESLNAGRRLSRPVWELALQADGKVLIGGPITSGLLYWGPNPDTFPFVASGRSHGRARLRADGAPDPTFMSAPFNPDLAYLYPDCPGLPFGCTQGAFADVRLVQPDGHVILVGYAESTITSEETFDQIYRPFAARFRPDGSRDGSFTPPTNAWISAAAQQPDGRILIGGMLRWNGIDSTVARLHPDGRVDSTFMLGQGPEQVSRLALQDDGRVVVAGRSGLARLNPDGTRDVCFNPAVSYGAVPDGVIRSLTIQRDGRIVIAGDFDTVNGVARNGIARIHPDGSLDGTFDPGLGANGRIASALVQPDGNILVAGDFTAINGVVRPFVARLLGDTTRPQLRLSESAPDRTLAAWPSSPGTYRLQQNGTLSPDGWTDVPEAPESVGGEWHTAIARGDGTRFFRLSGTPPAVTTYPAPPMVPPRGPTADAEGGRITIRWTPFAGAVAHIVHRATVGDGVFTVIGRSDTASYTDTEVIPGKRYFYRVSTVYDCGESLLSERTSAVP